MPRILVADDNANIQKMVALAFQDRGIDVTSVGNGEAAVRRLPDLNPDLVLADVFMPVRNGYEVCEFVKKDQRFAHIPVILLVGAFDPLDEKEARRVGADGVLKKPFVPPDPLIAMVLSALEKNPKVAAEMAKAKEVAAAPPPPPALEIAAKTEPKPLPDFPEPSPEEAAMIYGFGKGVRTLDDEDLRKGSKEPKAPVAQVEEEESDEMDAKKDWRRSAMDFEIPEEDAARPALSADEDLDAAMFPSEKDVPPRHVRMREIDTEAGIIEEESSPSDKTEVPSSVPAAIEIPLVPVLAVAQEEAPASEPRRRKTDRKFEEKSEEKPEPDATPLAAPQTMPQVVPDQQPRVAHWMDMMAPVPSESSSGDWMSALRASAVTESRPAAVASPVLHDSPAEPAEVIKAQQPVEAHAAASELPSQVETTAELESPGEVESASKVEAVSEVAALVAASAAPSASKSPAQAEAEEPFFADDLVESETPGSDHDLLVAAPDLPVSPSLRDPGLIQDVAVRVVPEPLLVNDEVSGPSDYNTRREETSPLHAFDIPVAAASVQRVEHHEEGSAEEAFASRNGTPAALPEAERVAASWPLAASNLADWTERVPTAPPSSREALSDIPFLMPPAPSQLQAAGNGVDSATVDAVVRKVLERLGSQIQDLLSQDALKPLVENLLENELAKKGK